MGSFAVFLRRVGSTDGCLPLSHKESIVTRNGSSKALVPKTTPLPVLGLRYRPSCDGVLVEIAKLFDALVF
jgi:hypothetical protein